ncbi:MarR family winged helix-turn-helix transcriptional regulator [Curtanaerobium respiraculi]|jgi:DNA-binding MarR family transcriptional regulator|uniref:MarR family winged helix-turn-helix transcriptional regulator n=1 Tax=Curtanaerobium respiraculi TaxID=2949669 RepID=UPI0024B35CFB|nr:MarR family transcriptional regulator [Curtanaerobium respiraculi]
MQQLNPLALDNQLCFPLYAASKEIVRRYGPLLDKIGLTYTQYIAMMVLWEDKNVSVKQLGERLHLDSGTLTPLLKKLEAKGLVTRTRSTEDERRVDISLTQEGKDLRSRALSVPGSMAKCVPLEMEDALALRDLLNKLLRNMEEE